MASSSIISSLAYAEEQITIYVGVTILIAGVVGGFLNTIVFLSLKTFRQSSCAFYLTVMSIVNIGQLITGLLSRIMITGFAVDWTQTSIFYCKVRLFIFQTCELLSCTCLCLAIIDQFLATCSRPRWQQLSNIKLAYRLIMAFSIIWLLHDIPYLFFFNQVHSPSTGKVACTTTNAIFLKYRIYFTVPILGGLLPVIITILFGYMAYRNVQQLAHRTLPLVRRELDKQLTAMVLVQIVFNCFCSLPFTIMNSLTSTANLTNDPVMIAKIYFIAVITLQIFYSNFANPFYIYVCVSERFRRQLIYVFCRMHLNRWQQPRIGINQVVPQLQIALPT